MRGNGNKTSLPVPRIARIQAYRCPLCGYPVYTAQPHYCPKAA